MIRKARPVAAEFSHAFLDNGVEVAVDQLPQRNTASLCFRMLVGLADDPPELTGISSIVEQTLAKGTASYTGRQLADALDALGVEWNSLSGRQSTLIKLVCLPEFVLDAAELIAEMICRPVFSQEACEVAVKLALEDLQQMEDDPGQLLRYDVQRLTLGPIYGRNPAGEVDTLPCITPDAVREHWRRHYHAGRLQIAAAGPIEPAPFCRQIERLFAGFGDSRPAGRQPADFEFAPRRHHRSKDLKQQYIGITLPGMTRDDPLFSVERVLLGVLSGGMSGRLFAEVREKQGLVYWVGAWHEQPRGRGVIHLGASSTPENCERTYRTLLRELERVGEDLTDNETCRARDGLIAHMETEDDLTRARTLGLSDDLFHYGRPIGPLPKIAAIRTVNVDAVAAYARQLRRDEICVATVGPKIF